MSFLRLSARRVPLLLSLAVAAGCNASSVSSPTANDEGAALAAELAFCRDEINRYRASASRPPLARSQALEDFATRGAEIDHTVRIPHHHFTMTNGGGTAAAETEILWWRGGTVRTVIQQGLAQMWQAGGQGTHYKVLVGPYTEVGCGLFINDGEVTVVQDFR
jgi:hypothetical protein